MTFINKYSFIEDPDAKNAIIHASKLRAQILQDRSIISRDKYKKKYIDEAVHGQSKNSRQDIKSTKPERRVAFALRGLGLTAWREYKIIGHYFDFYVELPNAESGVLIEVDGEFWHKEKLEEAKYLAQKKNFFNDIVKNAIASAKGIPLIRIREGLINSLDGEQLRDELRNKITEALNTNGRE
jgi:hypothetical protein